MKRLKQAADFYALFPPERVVCCVGIPPVLDASLPSVYVGASSGVTEEEGAPRRLSVGVFIFLSSTGCGGIGAKYSHFQAE